jgi:RHS repeat-associated protein
VAAYVYGPPGRIAKQTTINNETTTYYYHTDHLGSTRMVTDETGTPLTSVTYYPFGRTNECTGSSQSYLFIGKEEDATGLYYLNQRYYDPETGRFITRDPYTWLPDDFRSCGHSGNLIRWLITPQRFDGYSYAENNPVRYSDPTGLSHYLECCDNQACTNFCADDDAPNSNPGGSEGSQKYPVGDPDDPQKSSEETEEDEGNHSTVSRTDKCRDCDCKDRPDIIALKKLKRNVEIGKYSVTFAYAILCGIAAGMLCIETGPGAAICGIVGGAVCAFVFGLLTDASVDDIIDDINSVMDDLQCSCAIYCD